MGAVMHNPLVFLADFVLPLVVALVFCLRWGPNRGILFAVIPALIGVFLLFFLQVSPGVNPDGSGRVASAFGYMTSESIMWIASFMVGAAFGSVIWKLRRPGGKG
jgi:nitrate/nitrite transporter NarK